MKKTIFILLQFICFIFSASAISKTAKQASLFAWSVEKDGKTHYILGTLHEGVSLEDIPCSNKIKDQIEDSDLILLEFTIAKVLNHLSKEELKALLAGSKQEQEKALSKLSPEAQWMAVETLKIRKQMFFDRFIYEGTEKFEDLSEEAREFLISHGADIQGDYADFFYFILTMQYNDALFSFGDFIEFQIARIAQSTNIGIEDLEARFEMLNDMRKAIKKSNEEKPKHSINRDDIEFLVANYELGVKKQREFLLHLRTVYLSGDDKELLKLLALSVALEEVLLKQRNELWLKKLIEAHENPEYESLFLVAGSRHFIGSFNLIDLLKKEGFSINRISCPIDTVQN